MPSSIAWFSAAMAFSSSSYMRKRLPQPKARIETFAFVRPSVRFGSEAIVGWASTPSGKSERPTPAVVRPTRSRNFLRDKSFLMSTSPALENDCSAEPRKRRGSPRVGSRPAMRKGNGCKVRHAAGESDSITDGFPQDLVSLAPLRVHARTGPSGLFASFCPLAFLISPDQPERFKRVSNSRRNWVCLRISPYRVVGNWRYIGITLAELKPGFIERNRDNPLINKPAPTAAPKQPPVPM